MYKIMFWNYLLTYKLFNSGIIQIYFCIIFFFLLFFYAAFSLFIKFHRCNLKVKREIYCLLGLVCDCIVKNVQCSMKRYSSEEMNATITERCKQRLASVYFFCMRERVPFKLIYYSLCKDKTNTAMSYTIFICMTYSFIDYFKLSKEMHFHLLVFSLIGHFHLRNFSTRFFKSCI